MKTIILIVGFIAILPFIALAFFAFIIYIGLRTGWECGWDALDFFITNE